jgi:tRNA A37 threonylcarbamoyladenosine biosynthesis protein TsaE
MVGRAKETHFIDKITEAFLRKIDPFGFIVIRGSYGIGKSLLIRMILYRIKSDEHKFL